MASTAELASFDAVLKEVYEKSVISQLQRKTPILDMFMKETELPWSGREVVWPIEIQGTESVGFTAEYGTLPDPGTPVYVDVKMPMRFTHGRVQFSQQVLQASRTSKGAFKRAMETHMSALIRDLAFKREFALWHDGSAKLALMNDTGGATFELKGPGGVGTTQTNANRYINPKMNIAVVRDTDADGVADLLVGARSVTSINTDGTDITPNSSLTTVAGDWVVWAANSSVTNLVTGTSANKAPMGMLGLVDDGTYVITLHGVNRNTYPQYQSRVFASVGAVSADVLQQAADIADQLSGGEGIDKWMCHHSVRRAILKTMEADRRYTNEHLMRPDMGTAAVKGPSKGKITFGGIPFQESYHAPYGILFGVSNASGFTRWVDNEGEWASNDNRVLRNIVNQDAWEAFYRIFDNFSIDRPNCSVRLDGITADVVSIHIY